LDSGVSFLRSFGFASIDWENSSCSDAEDQHPFAAACDQELSTFCSFRQVDSMSDPQWCERFNTKVDVGDAIGVTHQRKSLLEWMATELHGSPTTAATFDNLTVAQQETAQTDAEERHASHFFLRQSGAQHGKLKVDPQNDFTTGDNHCPKTHQQTHHLLDKCSKATVIN
jgi:hypothetical protein